jgi:endonuclease YncB( thermonuclease family)
MPTQHLFAAVCASLAVVFASVGAFAHSGGLDRHGCHHDRKRGGYHCHRKPSATPASQSFSLIAPAQASSLRIGMASAVDGDTLVLGGQRIRLHGIDAFEPEQRCERDGRRYSCGGRATQALAEKLGSGPLLCEPRGTDRYDRTLATCRIGRTDIGAWMVRQGWAVAYTRYARDYADDEAIAQRSRKGAWAGQFETPEQFRRSQRTTIAMAARDENARAGACRIKGDIRRNGERFYLNPNHRRYTAVTADVWFCTEAAAQAAGFTAKP